MNNAHAARYEMALIEYQQARRIEADRNWRCLLYLCTAPPSLWEKVRAYLDLPHGEAHLQELVSQEYLSGGERRLMSLARNLFSCEGAVDVSDLINTLDDDMWQVAVAAVKVRRGEA